MRVILEGRAAAAPIDIVFPAHWLAQLANARDQSAWFAPLASLLDIFVPAQTAAYVAALALVFGQGKGMAVFRWLADAGRMPLTNYLAQSAICAFVLYGSGLGLGDKLFAVPWSALTLDTANKRFLLDVDKERLKSAPGFDKNAWPRMTDRAWSGQVHEYYGVKPYRDH